MNVKNITVLHVLNSAGGGAAMSTVALMERLRAFGISSCAVCDDRGSHEERAALRAAAEGRVEFTPLYWWNRKIRSSAWKRPILEARQLFRTGWKRSSTRKVLHAADRWRADLIHTNTLLTPEGGLAARKLGIPHVWHLRELVGPNQPFQFGREGEDLGSLLVEQCDRLIANSESAAAQIRRLVPADFMCVIPNGIDCGAFARLERPKHRGETVVGMVASLTSRMKRHDLFIEGCSLVDKALPIECRIYGHDPSAGGRNSNDAYVAALHGLARSTGLLSRLRLPGHLPPVQIMSEIDILVHPTEFESFGRVVIEALAAGIPVIGANGGGVAELLEQDKTGLLFRPNDSADLARCVERMIQDKALAERCGAAGRELVQQRYSIDVTAQKVAQVYQDVLRFGTPENAPGAHKDQFAKVGLG